MKSAVVLLATLLTAQVAQARPPKHAAALASPTKDTFACELVELTIWGSPDGGFGNDHDAAVRLKCTNTSKTTIRLKESDVWLVDTNGDHYAPEQDAEKFGTFFEDDDDTESVEGFIDIAPGEVHELGFVFADAPEVGRSLVVDVNGTQYRAPKK